MAIRADIRVQGLDQVVRGFRRIDGSLAREVQMELKSIAGFVADDARTYATAIGLRDSGDLAHGIKPFYRGATAGVRSTVKRRGYPYGGVYEFGKGGARAFLAPTVKRDEAKIVEAFEDMLDRLISSAGLGRGGVL